MPVEHSQHSPPKLVDEHPMLVLPSLAMAVGLNEAVLLQQLHFLLRSHASHTRDQRQWVYNTYEQWQTVFPFWKPRMLRILLTDLEQRGLLLSGKYNHSKSDQTKWYTIDYEQLSHVTQNVNPCDVIRQPMWQNTSGQLTQNVDSNQRLSTKTFYKEENPPTPFQGDAPTEDNGAVPATGKRQRKIQTLRTDYSAGFLAWWGAYPPGRRLDKPLCFEKWQECELEPRTAELVEKIERLKATTWCHTEPKNIKTSLPYLNSGRYEDDLVPLPDIPTREDTGLSEAGYASAKAAQRAMAELRQEEEEKHGGFSTTRQILSGPTRYE